eukprot:673263-Pelagomonas_calceolata.AAC.6
MHEDSPCGVNTLMQMRACFTYRFKPPTSLAPLWSRMPGAGTSPHLAFCPPLSWCAGAMLGGTYGSSDKLLQAHRFLYCMIAQTELIASSLA